MKLLAIDTSASACSLALITDQDIHVSHEIAPMQQARMVLPAIDALLKSANIESKDLDAIAYACGPGSFTGVRIAGSVAQALSFAHQKPLIAVSSLAALAQAAYEQYPCSSYAIAIDARMNQLYWATYKINADGWAEIEQKEIVCSAQEIILPHQDNWYGLGDAWVAYKEALHADMIKQTIKTDTSDLITGKAIALLAKIKFEKGEWDKAGYAQPVYLR